MLIEKETQAAVMKTRTKQDRKFSLCHKAVPRVGTLGLKWQLHRVRDFSYFWLIFSHFSNMATTLHSNLAAPVPAISSAFSLCK